MSEGPSKTYPSAQDPRLSPEIRLFDAAQNLISGAVLAVYVQYPDVHPGKWDVLDAAHNPTMHGPLTAAVNAGVKALQDHVAAWVKGCRLGQLKIALVGYSMGAWVINKWLKEHPEEWIVIGAVVLYGDPCYWYKPGPFKGLARAFHAAGCSPAKDYPYPAPSGPLVVPFKIKTQCLVLDPVCGWGYDNATLKENLAQLKAAENCSKKNRCTHLTYTNGAPQSGALAEGARFVVRQLLG
jgi:hypothetical protein